MSSISTTTDSRRPNSAKHISTRLSTFVVYKAPTRIPRSVINASPRAGSNLATSSRSRRNRAKPSRPTASMNLLATTAWSCSLRSSLSAMSSLSASQSNRTWPTEQPAPRKGTIRCSANRVLSVSIIGGTSIHGVSRTRRGCGRNSSWGRKGCRRHLIASAATSCSTRPPRIADRAPAPPSLLGQSRRYDRSADSSSETRDTRKIVRATSRKS